MRCLVTGATGHIGSHLVRSLLENDAQVAVLLRPTSDAWRIEDVLPRLQTITGDVSSICEADRLIHGFAPEVVFHLAWYGVSKHLHNHASQLSQNVSGSIELLRIACESGCRRWIGLGSQAEYGIYDRILTENLPARPVTYYGRAKLYVCLLAQRLCEDWKIDFVWPRLTASYGPMDNSDHLIPSVILSLLRGERKALTTGEQRWDYIYVEDVVNAIYKLAVAPGANGVFNLGSGTAHAIRTIVERVRDLIDPSLPLGFGEVPHNAEKIRSLQIDNSRLRQATDWSPQVSLDEGLRRTVEWYSKNYSRSAG